MRIGIFSDIHANIEALTAVLEAFRAERIDKYVCIGDTVGYGASPNECCDLVRGQAAFTILGNHDAAVAGRMDYSYYYDAARQALDLHAAVLKPENMRWLQSLPYEVREGHISFCHGSPLNLEEFEYIFAPEQAARCLGELPRLAERRRCHQQRRDAREPLHTPMNRRLPKLRSSFAEKIFCAAESMS